VKLSITVTDDQDRAAAAAGMTALASAPVSRDAGPAPAGSGEVSGLLGAPASAEDRDGGAAPGWLVELVEQAGGGRTSAGPTPNGAALDAGEALLT
jgi:hypothetical protein